MMRHFKLASSFIIAFITFPTAAYAENYLTLEQAWVGAYQNNPSLEAERARLRALDEKVAQANSHWRPEISLNAGVGRNWQHLSNDARSFTTESNFAHNGDTYGAQIKQPLFRPQNFSEHNEAKQEVLAGRARLQSVEQQLLLDAGKAFLDTLRDEEILQIDRDEEIVLQKKLEETSVRAKVGDLTQTDVRQAQTRLSKAEVTRQQAENTLTSDRASFLRLVGAEPEKLSIPQLALAGQTMAEVLHASDTINPSVVSAEYTVEAAKANIDLNKNSLLPEIDLVGSSSNDYGQSSTFPGRSITNKVMIQATWQLYDGGSSYSKIREARQSATQHRMELEDVRHKSHEQGRNAWQELQSAERSIKSDQAEVTAATEALEGVKTEARVGARTTLDVLNAEQELLDAKIDLARAVHDRDYAVLEIKSAMGDLTADKLSLPLEPYNPEKHYNDNAGKLAGFGDDDDYVVSEQNKLADKN